MSTFGKRLQTARYGRSLTQVELETLAGLSPGMVSHFESDRRDPSLKNFRKLKIALNVSAEYLLGT